MPASTIEYRLRIRNASTVANPDGTTDVVSVSSTPGGTNPYIASEPSGDGQEVDPLTGAVRTGSYTVEIVDANTGTDATGTIRYLTALLEDAGARQQLLSRRAYVEISTNGGAFSTLVAGYVTSIRLVSPMRYAVQIGDTRRVDQTQTIFQGGSLPPYTTRGTLTGGPLTGNWGPVQARGGWAYRVTNAGGGNVSLSFLSGYISGRNGPIVTDWTKVERPEIADVLTSYERPNPFALSGGGSPYATAYTGTTFDPTTGSWDIDSGVVAWIGTATTAPVQVKALVCSYPANPPDNISIGVSDIYLYWPSCPYSTGQTVYCSLSTFEVTEKTPLYLDVHPVDLTLAIWTNARIQYNASGAWINTIRSLIGDSVLLACRFTSAPIIADFLESAVFGPFGISSRTNSLGEQELFSTRIRTSATPTLTLGVADMRSAEDVVFELDERTAVSQITMTQQFMRPAIPNTGSGPRKAVPRDITSFPLDGVLVSPITQTAQYDDINLTVFTGRAVDYAVPGMIHTQTTWEPAVSEQLKAIAVGVFDRYGRGAVGADVQVLAGSSASAAQIGDEIYFEAAHFPNKGYRIGESSVGARIMQVVRRTESPSGPILRLLDSGLDAQPATLPSLALAKSAGAPTTTALYTISNAAALNASGVISVRVQWVAQFTTPTGAGADHAVYAPGQIPTTAVALPGQTVAGRLIWARARSEQAGRRPSNWTAWGAIPLDNLPSVTGLAASNIKQTAATIAWTNTSTAYPLIVYAYQGASAPADWSAYQVATLPAGSTSTAVRSLTGPSIAWRLGVAYDGPGAVGPVVSVAVTTNSTTDASTRPAGLAVIPGVDDVTLEQGVALAMWASDQTLDLVIERSTTSGSGFAQIARVAGSTPTYADALPRNGITYYYRIAHALGGFALSTYSQEVSAIARGVPRDMVRPDAVTPVVQVTTAEASGTATVTLAVTDPQGRVAEVRFRHRTGGGAYSAWTVDTSVPYAYSAAIPATGFVDIQYEVNGYTAAGEYGLLAGGTESFDQGTSSDMVSVVGTFSAAGVFTLAISADSDTASLRFATSTSSQPTLATTQAATAQNTRNYTTTLAGPFAAGTTVFVSVLGYTAVSGGGAESVLFQYSFIRDGGILYTQCIATAGTSSATQIVVTVTATAPTGTPTVQLVAVTGSAVLPVGGGAAIGVPVASGSSWTFNRGDALGQPGGAQFRAVLGAAQSDDDFIEIPEKGRDTTYLASRARVLSTSNTEVVVRYAVLDKYSQLTSTITYTAMGVGAITPLSWPTVLAAVGDSFTVPESLSTYIDFTIQRPAFQAGAGRVIFMAAATGRVSDTDSVDVPAVEQDTRFAQCLAVMATSTASTVTVTVTGSAVGGTPTVQLVAVTGSAVKNPSSPNVGVPQPSGTQWTFTRGAALGQPGGAQFRAVLAGTQSDDDFIEVPEQGRDTTYLASRARVTGTTDTTVTVRYAVADPYPQGSNSVTVSYQSLGVTSVLPASGGTLTPVATLTEAFGTYIDYTIGRPAFGAGTGRVTYTATASGRVSDSDAVDVPAQERDTINLLSRARIFSQNATQMVIRYAVATPVALSPNTATITYITEGLSGILPGSPQTVTPETNTVITESGVSYVDFTVPRPIPTATPGRITFQATATGRTASSDAVDVSAQDIVGPSLSVVTTPSASVYTMLVTYIGTISYSLDGVAQSTAGWASPYGLVVSRNEFLGATQIVALSATRSGSTVSETVNVPPKDNAGATITIGTQSADQPSNLYTFTWSTSGMPTGTTYDLTYTTTTTAGDVEQGTLNNQTSPVNVYSGYSIGSSPRYQMTVTAIKSGTLVLVKSRSGTFFT
jgi:hypothetical protein